jgi:hypothetical protein
MELVPVPMAVDRPIGQAVVLRAAAVRIGSYLEKQPRKSENGGTLWRNGLRDGAKGARLSAFVSG